MRVGLRRQCQFAPACGLARRETPDPYRESFREACDYAPTTGPSANGSYQGSDTSQVGLLTAPVEIEESLIGFVLAEAPVHLRAEFAQRLFRPPRA